MSRLNRLAVLDLGSNSVRMLVVEANADGQWRVIDEARALLRLGDCLMQRGVLAPLLPTAIWVVCSWVQRARQAGVDQIVAVATAALRAAPDGAAFTRSVEQASGIRIRIVDGQEEASLGFLGAMQTLDIADGNLVDLGGASTELTSFASRQRLRSVSMALGSVTLGRRFFTSDPPTATQVASAEKTIRKELSAVLPDPAAGLPLVAVGGSFRSIAKMQLRASGYPLTTLHNYQLSPSVIDDFCLKLGRMTASQRRQVPGLAAHRAETVLGALALAQGVCKWLKPSVIVISGTGLREGVMFEQLHQRPPSAGSDLLEISVDNLLFQLAAEPDPALLHLAGCLAHALSPLLPKDFMPLIVACAKLRALGQRVNFYDRHTHTFYLIIHSRLFGLSHGQQVVLAAAAGYEGPHRLTQVLRPYAQLIGPEGSLLAARLGLVVAFAEALLRQHPAHHLEVGAQISAKEISLTIQGSSPAPTIPYDELSRLSGHFAKVFGRKLRTHFSAV